MCQFQVGKARSVGDLLRARTHFDALSESVLRIRTRVNGLAQGAGALKPGQPEDLELRMALALDVHGIDPFELDKLSQDLAQQAEIRLSELRSRNKRN